MDADAQQVATIHAIHVLRHAILVIATDVDAMTTAIAATIAIAASTHVTDIHIWHIVHKV